MRLSNLPFVQTLFASCAVAMAVAVPLSCAQGSVEGDIPLSGPNGAGGSSTQVGHGGQATTGTATEVTVTATTTGGFPTSTTATTTGGFPSASSTSTTTGGFPTAASSTAATTGSSSSGSSSACDNTDCDTCQMCAQELNSCMNAFNDCENDDGCFDILICWECGCAPGDTACLDECIAGDPGSSADLFNAWANCVVCSCQETCAIPAGSCP